MLEDNLFTEEERKRFFSIYSLMAVDYVLVSKKTKKIICMIELNDSTHESAIRKERDQKLGALMKASSIPFMPISTDQITIRPDIWKFRENNRAMN